MKYSVLVDGHHIRDIDDTPTKAVIRKQAEDLGVRSVTIRPGLEAYDDWKIYSILEHNKTSLNKVRQGLKDIKHIAVRNGIIRRLCEMKWEPERIAKYLHCPKDYVGRVLDDGPKSHGG